MQNPRSLSDLLSRTGNKLNALKTRSEDRARIATLVREALPPRLALTVTGAELSGGRLTVGVTGAAWASRIRYCGDELRLKVGAATATPIESIRVKVVPSA
jgi:Dna[CI] antecedent, DciA